MELFWIKELIGESHKISLSGKHVGADLNKTTLFFEDNCFVSAEMRLALRFTFEEDMKMITVLFLKRTWHHS